MPTSIRQLIINEIDTRLKTILTANGYETDIGNKVFQWKTTPLSKDEPLGLVFRDTQSPITLGESAISKETHNMNVEVEILAKESNQRPETLRKAMADVWRAIGFDTQWNSLAESTWPVFDSIGVDHKGEIISGALIIFQVDYVTDLFDPYNQ